MPNFQNLILVYCRKNITKYINLIIKIMKTSNFSEIKNRCAFVNQRFNNHELKHTHTHIPYSNKYSLKTTRTTTATQTRGKCWNITVKVAGVNTFLGSKRNFVCSCCGKRNRYVERWFFKNKILILGCRFNKDFAWCKKCCFFGRKSATFRK